MTTLLSRAFDALRVWFGLNDPSENHLHASHGWLLPPSADGRPRVLAVAPAVAVRVPSGRVR
jgi:hypothetical protein